MTASVLIVALALFRAAPDREQSKRVETVVEQRVENPREQDSSPPKSQYGTELQRGRFSHTHRHILVVKTPPQQPLGIPYNAGGSHPEAAA